jgi:hypothetical protein
MAVFDNDAKDRFLRMVREGVGPVTASETCGVTWATVKRHLKDDHVFAEGYVGSREILAESLEKRAIDAATDPEQYRHRVVMDVLKALKPDVWGDKQRIEHTGPHGGPVTVVTASIDALREALTAPDTRAAMLDAIDVTPPDLLPGPGELEAGG